MILPPHPVAYVLASTNHGTMIVNRNDHAQHSQGQYGVGLQLLTNACFDPYEVALVKDLLGLRRQSFGDGVVAIDGGANLGVHTIEWCRHMTGWGKVLAFEAQEYVFYALAGNIAINNCWNASARWMALGEQPGEIMVPEPDYLQPGSFGSLELRQSRQTEFIGQKVSYEREDCIPTPMTSIDTLALERLDFLKLDVEGMEVEVLRGARATVERHKPMMLVESLKSDRQALQGWLHEMGYVTRPMFEINLLALHQSDPTRGLITFNDGVPFS